VRRPHNPGKRPLNAREPKPRAVAPTCPDELSPAAQQEWKRNSRQLLRLGLLIEIDRAALATYCQAWTMWLDAVAQIQRTGAVVKAPSGYARRACSQTRPFA
jgi:P27 family predicted phage terminase small subunit